jgi:hypothetical protein
MSDEELVKRLREDQPVTQDMASTMQCALQDEAADRIHALIEQLEAARADAKEAEAYAEELAKDQVDLCSQLIAAEDKLAKAVEGLRFYATQDVTFPGIGTVTFAGSDDNGRKARTTLAEIEGEKG